MAEGWEPKTATARPSKGSGRANRRSPDGGASRTIRTPSDRDPTRPGRVYAYVDGYNVYHGMKSKRWERYLWLDYWALLDRLIKPNQVLAGLRYFTSRGRGSEEARQRQAHYLDALIAHRPQIMLHDQGPTVHVHRYKRGIEVSRKTITEIDVAADDYIARMREAYSDAQDLVFEGWEEHLRSWWS